jgi:hypothetical protein
MCRIAARKSGKLLGCERRTGRAPLRSHVDHDTKDKPQLRYNIHAGPGQATTAGAMG